MEITNVSRVDKDGKEYIVITLEKPSLDKNSMWSGGKCLSFHLDHKRQTAEAYRFIWANGVPQGFEKLEKKWSGEILSKAEMVEFAENFKW